MTDTDRDIEAMAREAGLCCDNGNWFTPAGDPEDEIDVSTEDLARFAELVRADERERCAKHAASLWMIDGQQTANEFASEIRLAP